MVEHMTDSVAVHPDPVWRSRSNFVLSATLPANGTQKTIEQLWGRRLSEYSFEICCIPFFVYGISLADVVSTSVDGKYLVTEVTGRSGRATYRAWFGDSTFPQRSFELEIASLGGLTERSSENLVAVDAANSGTAERVVKYLKRLHDAGDLVFESGAAE
jgi:hypothetical protein